MVIVALVYDISTQFLCV